MTMNPDYLPSPDEIADACAMFQAGWSDEERYQRSQCNSHYVHVDPEVKRQAQQRRDLTLARHRGAITGQLNCVLNAVADIEVHMLARELR